MPDNSEYRRKNVVSPITDARQRMGFTQAELSNELEVDPHTVWYWESGKKKPSGDHLVGLAQRLGVSSNWLLGREVVEDDLLREANVSFMDAVACLPQEDLDSILNFIRFVREERARKPSRE